MAVQLNSSAIYIYVYMYLYCMYMYVGKIVHVNPRRRQCAYIVLVKSHKYIHVQITGQSIFSLTALGVYIFALPFFSRIYIHVHGNPCA